ncbi:patatin-like phospholipase family protein [Clostridium sp. AM58-1XD]|uniref:patatin-like phospholipase family protein n=1 Tax=Clostridium sp. AM58-1XD TaxID=2292307 RepID=UPI000E5426D5|nr:patatin-like phospholipase family protein [Clostridium sp. AM58-1XD]RGY99094.1 patatin [Clostridium sp. AM58-1XD]
MKYGLALAGGGTRGAAHAGVLLALEEEKMLPDFIAGTSAGSIAAGCFASGMRAEALCDFVHHMAVHGKEYLDPDIKELVRLIPQTIRGDKTGLSGLLKGERLKHYFCKITRNQRLEDIKMDLLIPAVDLISGDTICFTNRIGRAETEGKEKRSKPAHMVKNQRIRWVAEGRLCDIMMASSSVPGVFRPVHLNHCCLVDGGVVDNLPVDLMKAVGARKVVAVDIGSDYEMPEDDTIFEILSHSFSLMSSSLKDCRTRGEDVLLKPELTKKAGLLTFDKMEECMEEAYHYTKKNIGLVQRAVL